MLSTGARAGLLLSSLLLSGAGLAVSAPAFAADEAGAAGQPAAGTSAAVRVLQVVPGIYMLTVDGVNVVVQTGPDGTVVVDTGPASAASELLATIQRIAPQPIHYVIDTGADAELVGGNATVAAAGHSVATEDTFVAAQGRQLTSVFTLPGAGAGSSAPVIARQSVLTQMVTDTSAGYTGAALPTDTFTRPDFNFFSSEPISIAWLPAAHTDSDIVVRFERSDVVVAGEVFDPTRFPVIDLQHGGSLQGELDALDRLINTMVFPHTPVLTGAESTLVIPVHGPLSDLDDLVTYRDMVGTVRARVQYYIDRGRSYQQIVAADPTQGYHTRYGSDTGLWTTADFVEAVYKSLMAENKAHHGKRGS